jgi:PAS domain S-box-containing protein
MKVSHAVPSRDEYYEASSRSIRWVGLFLVLITFPFADTGSTGLALLTIVVLTAAYNALRYNRWLLARPFFASRLNSLTVDHIFVFSLVLLSGGLGSPYYPLFFVLILSVIAGYGIAGFAFALGSQAIIALYLLHTHFFPQPAGAEAQFVVKLLLLIIFCLVAEQTIRSRTDVYLFSNRFTRRTTGENQRLLALINSLSSAVLAVDAHGEVYQYNAAALEFLNTNKDIAGVPIQKLLPLHNHRGERVNLFGSAGIRERTVSRQDLEYHAADGSKIILDLTVSPVHTNAGGRTVWDGYMAVFRDITKQKSLDEERDEFISVTSHELRTPLAIAEANLSTALLPSFAKIPDKAKTLVEQAYQNVVFLSALIQDLTTLSRAERGDLKLDSQILNTTQFVEQLARDYRPQAEAAGLKLELTAPVSLRNIVTSEPELREILQNFLTNAIKYTHAGKVTLAVTENEQGTEFSVSDTGIGVSASDKTKLFTKFFRSEDYRTRKTGGTGLGLYITRKLAEKLGARISFTSRLNHGSTFKVFVPIGTDSTNDT